MPDQTKHVSRPWRRFLRFSVRGMIVLVLVIGGWLGWLFAALEFSARRWRRSRTPAVKSAMTGNGTTVRTIRGGEPWAPRWLVDLIGVDYFGHVTDVRLHQPTDSQIVMVCISRDYSDSS